VRDLLESRVAGAHVVDRDLEAEAGELGEGLCEHAVVLDRVLLGDLEDDAVGRKAEGRELADEALALELGVVEGRRQDVDEKLLVAGQRPGGLQRAAAALAVELEGEVRLGRELEEAQGRVEEGALGAPRERLEPEHRLVAQVHHGLEDGGELVLEQDLLQRAAPQQVPLPPLHAHARPRLVHEARDQAVGHDERVLEHQAEAHDHLPRVGQVRRGQADELAVQVVLHPLGGRAQVSHLEPAFGALGREEHQERVAPLVVHSQEVAVANVVAAQLEQQVAGHAQHLLESARAVVVLHLGQLRDVDEQQAHAALEGKDVAQVGEPLPVGDRLDSTVGHADRTWPGEVGCEAPGAPGAAPLVVAAAMTRLRPCRLAS
jgi:hypothetical protein